MFKYSTQVINIMINNAPPVSIISQESKLGTWHVFYGITQINKKLVSAFVLFYIADRSINLFSKMVKMQFF